MMLFNILQETLLFTPMILGIYLTFRLLKITDLTADGSFVLGSGIYAKGVTLGIPYPVAMLLGLLGGALVGGGVSILERHHRIPAIVASLLALFMLQSINLLITGTPTLSLLLANNFFIDLFQSNPQKAKALLLLYILITMGLFIAFIGSKWGLRLRAFGSNYALAKRANLHPERIRMMGLMVANILYALSGIALTHLQNFTDIHMGMGMALMGIGSVIIGRQLFILMGMLKRDEYGGAKEIFACLFGAFTYFCALDFLLAIDIDPSLVKLFLGLLLTLIFSFQRDA